AISEMVLNNFCSVYGLQLTILRSCNLVGAHQRGRKLIPTAVTAIKNGLPVPIHGTGLQMREWLAVEDLCRALILLLQPSTPTGTYQAASGVHLSVLKVAQLVAQALGVALAVNHQANRLVQDNSYAMDFSSLRKLGWHPSKPPENAIIEAAKKMGIA